MWVQWPFTHPHNSIILLNCTLTFIHTVTIKSLLKKQVNVDANPFQINVQQALNLKNTRIVLLNLCVLLLNNHTLLILK